MFQHHTLIGTLVTAPALNRTPDGQTYARFTVTLEQAWTNCAGHTDTHTVTYRVLVWDAAAMACAQLAVGQRVVIEADALRIAPQLTLTAAGLTMTLDIAARVALPLEASTAPDHTGDAALSA